MEYGEINDSENKTKDVTNLGRWGNGDVQISITNMNEIDYAMILIKQAFDIISEEEN